MTSSRKMVRISFGSSINVMRVNYKSHTLTINRCLQSNNNWPKLYFSTNVPNSVTENDEEITRSNTTLTASPQIYRLRRVKTQSKSTEPFSIEIESKSIASNPNPIKKANQSFSSHLSAATARHRDKRRLQVKKVRANFDDYDNVPSNQSNHKFDGTFDNARNTSKGSVVAHMSATAKHRRSRSKASSSSNIPNPSTIAILNADELEEQYQHRLKTTDFESTISHSSFQDDSLEVDKETVDQPDSDDLLSKLLSNLGLTQSKK